MPSKPLLIIAASAFTAFPQMPAIGSFHYKLEPREAKVGQAVTFEGFEFNICLYDYDLTYELLPTPISSKKTTIINMIAKRRPKCATLVGYSGPKATFENLDAGVYVLHFDSTSDFQKDLGDTNRFEISPPSTRVSGYGSSRGSGDKSGYGYGTQWKWMEKRTINGREIR